VLNYESVGILLVMLFGTAACLYFIRLDWRKYGLLYALSALTAIVLCYSFTFAGFYAFPNNVLHQRLLIPYGVVATVFPSMVLFGIRYSPKPWIWKIPFYWTLIHLGVAGEVVLLFSSIFTFSENWDLWDSYTLWWIYLLFFELLGDKIVPAPFRKPIQTERFRYGRWGWIAVHVILVSSIFLAGVYFGVRMF
jgi:hypothetical protein